MTAQNCINQINPPATCTPEYSTTVVLTSAQIKNLAATPIQLIPAPGSGKVIKLHNVVGKAIYGGNDVFTNINSLSVRYSGVATPLLTLDVSGLLAATSTNLGIVAVIGAPAAFAATTIENIAIVILNAFTEITGNASNDNTLTITSYYEIISI